MISYKTLTSFLTTLEAENFGEWIVDNNSKGTAANPIQMPYVSYSDLARQFINEVYTFSDSHPEYKLNQYQDILFENSVEWDLESMKQKDVSASDGNCIMALIMGAVRADRFSSGALLNFFQTGAIAKWLKRLKEIDEE